MKRSMYPRIKITYFNEEQVSAAASATMTDLNNTWKSEIANEYPSSSRMVDFANALEFTD